MYKTLGIGFLRHREEEGHQQRLYLETRRWFWFEGAPNQRSDTLQRAEKEPVGKEDL